MRISHAFWKLFYYGRCAAELKKDHIESGRYSAVFFAYNEPVSNMIGIYARRKQIHILQYGFDDGTQDYFLNLIFDNFLEWEALHRIIDSIVVIVGEGQFYIQTVSKKKE